MEVKKGIFYCVGIGPGDPELLTIKAARVLGACAVIAAPQTQSGQTLALDIAKQAVNFEGKTILPLYFTMSRDKAKQRGAHEDAAALVINHLSQGTDVAMLNLGDVSIYATGGYMMELIKEQGYETVMIPGVPSFCAVAARLGQSLTEMNRPLHIVPAGGGTLEEELSLSGTKVLMKSGSTLPAVASLLKEKGLLGKASMVKDCGLPDEAVFTDLSQLPASATGYFATIIVKE